MYTPLMVRAAPRVVLALVAVTALGACSNTTGPATGARPSLSLSISSRPPVALASAQLAAGSSTTGAVALTKVQIVLSHIELSRKDSGACNAGGDGECDEMHGPPVLIDVPLTGVNTLLTVPVDAGTYKKLDAELREPDSSDAAGRAFASANPTFARTNVRVEGTYNGVPFVYSALVEGELEMRFNPPWIVTAASKNLSVAIDISRWFVDPSTGGALDPMDAANAQTIAHNIRASFNAHEDEDRRG